MDRFAALRAIERRDPDGGEREPTDADYAAHKAWAIATFGQSIWEAYRVGGWAENQTSQFVDDIDYGY